jgi:hypothetical protein
MAIIREFMNSESDADSIIKDKSVKPLLAFMNWLSFLKRTEDTDWFGNHRPVRCVKKWRFW